jgi:hypothetical protein
MRRLIALLAALAALSCCRAQEPESMSDLRDRVFALAKVQALYMDSLLTDLSFRATPQAESRNLYPRTFQGDTLVTTDIGWWCSGFYPGVLWQLYEETDDEALKDLAVKYTLPLAGLLERETDHDIGFQLMSSFGKMWWHTCPPNSFYSKTELADHPREPGDSLFPMTVLARGADKLAARFNPDIGAIRSWNGARWNYPVIIDNMMNLELLMRWGHSDMADKHAVTTIQNHFREDGTTWHLVDYADDGTVLGKQTVQGYADDTAWARGQAWALYGYAMMASYGPNPLYEKTAWKLAQWLINHLPEDGIPYWDFSQTDYKDASAAAILAAGFLRLWKALRAGSDAPIDPDDPLLRTAERILRTLASPEYLAEPRTNGGFLLKHGVGNLPGKSEVDVPLTYADYYFLEALSLFPREASNGSD